MSRGLGDVYKRQGNYIIQIKLHKDVTAELTVKVVEK